MSFGGTCFLGGRIVGEAMRLFCVYAKGNQLRASATRVDAGDSGFIGLAFEVLPKH